MNPVNPVSTQRIASTRLGPVDVPETDVLDVPGGFAGLPGTRWAIVRPERSAPFAWLQSAEAPEVALPVVSPWAFFPDFAVDVPDAETERLGLSDADAADAEVLVVVRAAPRPEDCHANLRAPVLVVGGRAHQVLNDAPGAAFRVPLFDEAPTRAAEPAPA